MLDWAHPDWSYLLGVVHGDGSIAPRSVAISVGYRDVTYAETLCDLWRKLGFDPKLYRARSALRVDVHRRAIRDRFAAFKARGLWSWPEQLSTTDYLAGVFDTDGCVSTPQFKRVSIVLKRSGNLQRLVPMLESLGIRTPRVANRVAKYKGRPYDLEEMVLTGMDRIVAFSDAVRLRHYRKAERLAAMRHHVDELQARVPLWRRVGAWLQEEPRSWSEIATEFGLTKPQVDSVLQSLRRHARVEVIPPPKHLTRFRVSDL